MMHDENINSLNMHCGRKRSGNSFRIIFPLLAAALLQMTHPASSQAAGADKGVMSVEFLYSIEYTSGRSDRLREPMDLFFDRKKNELYIIDAATHKILIYDDNGMFVQDIPVTGASGPPTMIAVDKTGDIYVGYASSTKIGHFDYIGTPIGEIDLPGIIDAPGNTVKPMRLVSGIDGVVYALKSSGGLVKLDPNNEAHEAISISGDGQPNTIVGMGIDDAGRFLFTDMRPYSVVIFDPMKNNFKRFGSAGVLYGQIGRPAGVSADEAGHIFVLSGTLSKVSCFDKEGNFIEEFGKYGDQYGQFYMPTKIASDGKSRLFVLENALKRIQVFGIRFLKEEKPASSPQT